MLQFFKGIFMNGGPNPSSMRVMTFEIVQAALVIGLVETFRGTLSVDSIGLVLGMLGVALGGKVLQKGRETEPTPPEVK